MQLTRRSDYRSQVGLLCHSSLALLDDVKSNRLSHPGAGRNRAGSRRLHRHEGSSRKTAHCGPSAMQRGSCETLYRGPKLNASLHIRTRSPEVC
ncbi:hypothetical protein C2E23DRAFT_814443 [Lenzites betulinus]|nr:hypothetical protein C2E23DRAFT_814443 [Lenzites betulinus]